jgi:hypothetical protein
MDHDLIEQTGVKTLRLRLARKIPVSGLSVVRESVSA